MKRRVLMVAQVALLALIGNTVVATATLGPQHLASSVNTGQAGQMVTQAQPFTPAGTGFTYQGSLKSGGSPANGQYDFTFALFDAPAPPNQQIGSTITMTNQTVTNGLFTVTLDFGAGAFQGDARWLEIAVRQTGGGSFTTLSPRQPLTPAPYAAGLMPGAVISGTVSTAISVTNNSTLGTGIRGVTAAGGGPNAGVYGEATGLNGNGVEGVANNGTGAWGVEGLSASGDGVSGGSPTGAGVYGYSDTGTGLVGYTGGLYGLLSSSVGTSGYGVFGLENGGTNTAGVAGTSSSGYGGVFTSTSGIGLRSTSGSSWGLYVTSTSYDAGHFETSGSGRVGASARSGGAGGVGLYGEADNGANAKGVEGISESGIGLSGYSAGQYGLYSTSISATGYGVYGDEDGGPNAVGVAGTSSSGYGGVFTSTSGIGIVGSGGTYAGYFFGNVHATGSCCASGQGTIQIDDPTDPSNKYLNQSVVASPDMLEIYRGHVTLDANGGATVQLPSYFQALNRDFDYQLTPVGAPMPDVYVAQEIQGNTFEIAGGKPGGKVSWQVTGVRQDPYALAHPIQPEQEKPSDQKGKYLYPKELGQPETLGVDYEKAHPQPPVAQPTQQPLPSGH